MRYITPFLLFTCFLVPAFSQSPLTWNKKTYAPTGTSVERADFNGDGFSDLLIYGGSTTSVILNNGNGTFDATHVFTTGPLQTVAFLDFNRDGKMDVAGCDRNGDLDILLGNGNGSLTLAQAISDSCSWVATADFNRDKNPDIAVGVPSQSTDRTNNQVVVYLGNGRGQVASQVVNDHIDFVGVQGDACALNGSAEAADLNADHFDDIAITAGCTEQFFNDSALVVGKGDGTGHFTFHKDQDFIYAAGKHLRMGGISEFDNSGNLDLYEVTNESFPNGNIATVLARFHSKGDGTFFGFGTFINAFSSDFGNDGDTLMAATVADMNSDGIKDLVGINQRASESGKSLMIDFYKGIPNGDYNFTVSQLASAVKDMTWGDFDKNGTPDLVLVRPGSTDVWINTTASAHTCANFVPGRSIGACAFGSPGDFHFIGNPRNALPIQAIQVYVDGVKQYQTPNDLLSTHLPLTEGSHRITIKAWDDNGSFSAGIVAFGCPNENDRTVKICSPQNGAVINGATNQNVSLVGSAFSDSTFKATQVYVDGSLTLTTAAQYVNDALSLGKGIHRLTIKGWDVLGPFSSSVTVTVQ
jgi:hypothetical protein